MASPADLWIHHDVGDSADTTRDAAAETASAVGTDDLVAAVEDDDDGPPRRLFWRSSG